MWATAGSVAPFAPWIKELMGRTKEAVSVEVEISTWDDVELVPPATSFGEAVERARDAKRLQVWRELDGAYNGLIDRVKRAQQEAAGLAGLKVDVNAGSRVKAASDQASALGKPFIDYSEAMRGMELRTVDAGGCAPPVYASNPPNKPPGTVCDAPPAEEPRKRDVQLVKRLNTILDILRPMIRRADNPVDQFWPKIGHIDAISLKAIDGVVSLALREELTR